MYLFVVYECFVLHIAHAWQHKFILQTISAVSICPFNNFLRVMCNDEGRVQSFAAYIIHLHEQKDISVEITQKSNPIVIVKTYIQKGFWLYFSLDDVIDGSFTILIICNTLCSMPYIQSSCTINSTEHIKLSPFWWILPIDELI